MADVAHVTDGVVTQSRWRLDRLVPILARAPRTSSGLGFIAALLVALTGFGLVLLI